MITQPGQAPRRAVRATAPRGSAPSDPLTRHLAEVARLAGRGLPGHQADGAPPAAAVLADRDDGTVVRCGPVVAKAHDPEADPAELAVRVGVAAHPSCAGTLLPPLAPLADVRTVVDAATTGDGRQVSVWPYGEPLLPEDRGTLPWQEMARLLAQLHAVPLAELPARLPPMRGPVKAARAVARLRTADGVPPAARRAVLRVWSCLPDWVRGGTAQPHAGVVALCHGDLHLGQIVRYPAGPAGYDTRSSGARPLDGTTADGCAGPITGGAEGVDGAEGAGDAAVADHPDGTGNADDADDAAVAGPAPGHCPGPSGARGRPVPLAGPSGLVERVLFGAGVTGEVGWRLIDVDDLGYGDPAWDLARPAAWYAAGLLSPDEWISFLGAYRAVGGHAAGPGGDPWPRLDVPARALTVQFAALSLVKSAVEARPLDEVEEAVVDACTNLAGSFEAIG